MNVRFHAIALVFAAVAAPVSAQQLQIGKDNKTIAITTSDEATATADTAVVSVGFRIYGKDQDATYADASRTSNAIMAALTGSGIPKDAIESTQQNLNPIEPNGDADRTRYAQGLRFEFSQGWQVTVPAADASRLLQTAITAGANQSGQIDWQLKDESAIEADAARKALEHGRQIALRMAEGLGVRLGALLYASNEPPSRGIINGLVAPTRLARASNAKVNLPPIAITPQKITRSATVYAVFAIE